MFGAWHNLFVGLKFMFSCVGMIDLVPITPKCEVNLTENLFFWSHFYKLLFLFELFWFEKGYDTAAGSD